MCTRVYSDDSSNLGLGVQNAPNEYIGKTSNIAEHSMLVLNLCTIQPQALKIQLLVGKLCIQCLAH